jgi:hypothetical protein
MNQLTPEQQKEIEELSSVFFNANEIATIMMLHPAEFDNARLKEDDFNLPFMRGRLKKEAEIRKSIINLAVNGSSPAQILAVQIIEKSELKNIEV